MHLSGRNVLTLASQFETAIILEELFGFGILPVMLEAGVAITRGVTDALSIFVMSPTVVNRSVRTDPPD
jgi:hypothetical protein